LLTLSHGEGDKKGVGKKRRKQKGHEGAGELMSNEVGSAGSSLRYAEGGSRRKQTWEKN